MVMTMSTAQVNLLPGDVVSTPRRLFGFSYDHVGVVVDRHSFRVVSASAKDGEVVLESLEEFAQGGRVEKVDMSTTLRAGREQICVKKQWTVGSDSQPNEQIPTAHASTTAFRACGVHHVPEDR